MNYAVIDLGYGDSGKGTISEYLCRQHGSDLVVRFSGGPQASHHVVLPDGRWHGFSQWGAGTFAGVPTYLSKYMIVEPYAMRNEATELQKKGILDPWALLTVDPECLVICPWHWTLNRIAETSRGGDRHGSCGMGVGEAREDDLLYGGIRVKDLGDHDALYASHQRAIRKALETLGPAAATQISLENTRHVQRDHMAIRERMTVGSYNLSAMNSVVYEGSQGCLIDEALGFEPHRTWTDVTSERAIALSDRNVYVVGVVPAVWARHGSGPFPTEGTLGYEIEEAHNITNTWQGSTRHGCIDFPALRYVMRHVKVDHIAVTKGDLLKSPGLFCDSYYPDIDAIPDGATANDVKAFRPIVRYEGVEKLMQRIDALAPIKYVSTGPTHLDKTTL